jgi:hypothetical protein
VAVDEKLSRAEQSPAKAPDAHPHEGFDADTVTLPSVSSVVTPQSRHAGDDAVPVGAWVMSSADAGGGPPRPEAERRAAQHNPSMPPDAGVKGSGPWGDAAARYAENPVRPPAAPAPVPPSAATAGARPAPRRSAGTTPGRQAKLRISHFDVWSVSRFVFVVSLLLLVVGVVAVAMLWVVLDQAGVFRSVSNAIGDTNGDPASAKNYFAFTTVMLWTFLIGVVNVVIGTVCAALGTLIYNTCAGLIGGVAVTLGEDTT